MSEIAIWYQKNGTEWDRMEREMRLAGQDCFWKSRWNTANEWQTGTGDIIPNSHERYFSFTLG